MATGMAIKKVTITLDEAELDGIGVASGTASSVSGFVQHAVRVTPSRVNRPALLLAPKLGLGHC